MANQGIEKDNLIKKMSSAPTDPGCYIFRDKSGKILYIGKARNLRNRVKSYLSKGDLNPKTSVLVSKVNDVEFFVTNSEVEALILENTLIKKHKPRYNVCLRDDKTYPYIKITNEDFPRVFITRRVIDDGSKYFGPYTDVKSLRNTLRIINKIFQIRTCKYSLTGEIIEKKKVQLCLNYHIKKCGGPCQGLVSKDEYDRMINKVEAFLEGRIDEVVDYLKEKMDIAAKELMFEEAARYRDQIRAIQSYARKQFVELPDIQNIDLVYFIIESRTALAVLFRVRSGKLMGKEPFYIGNVESAGTGEVVSGFLERYYSSTSLIPDEVLLNIEPDNSEILTEWLSSLRGKKVRIGIPKSGEKLRLMMIAEKNAKLQFEELRYKEGLKVDFVPKTLRSLKKDLGLENYPRRIEAIDISNLKGKQPVGSVIVFEDGKPKKSEYRRYKIKTVERIDDYAMISEVVRRRYGRLMEEGKRIPDLILIDGGKGQVSVAKKELDSLGLDNVPVIGLAKKLEEIYFPSLKDPLVLSKASISLILLRRIRDEAHRFAISYHRLRRKKEGIRSVLDEIPGLGKVKRIELMKHFGSVEKLASVSKEDIMKVPGIGKKLAEKIWEHLHQ
ncbi:MAG: excinuclease ABC subunit C [Candidatus Neomarinimicrobiota bacterium]|nr:MAG: excinuclease ABC subunit C [Candidatus Neomarinimicrobiota bacterium]